MRLPAPRPHADAEQLLRLLHDVYSAFDTLTHEANRFMTDLGRITSADRDESTDERFAAFKHAVLAYISRFVEQLRRLRDQIVTSLDRVAALRIGDRIQVKQGDSPNWRRLTRQSHGTGSGGEKAVMLHLPLFAAMAAHYASAGTAPRLIVLDEVFAGIDRGTRGQLMGLLVSLDLDAVLTSHDEWGFYGELDGLSTYHLVRDPDVPGVLAEWFVWDGATRWDMTT